MPTQQAATVRWLKPSPLRQPGLQYAFAVAAVLAATLLRVPFESWLLGRAPYGLYFPALVVVAWTCGVRPTVFAALLSLACAWFFFVPPEYSFFPKEEGYAASLVIYAVTAGSLSWLARAASGARRELIAGFASRAQLAAIVESSDDAIIAKDLDGFIQSWNAGAERIFGYSADELIGRHVTALIPEERRFEEDRILAALRRGERIDHFETVRVAKDGRRLEISLTVSPIRDAEGQIVGASKIARDVTERRRVERALAQQREWFRVTLASIGDAVITTDRDGAITFMNPVAERLTGYPLHDADGRRLAEVFRVVNERTRVPAREPVREGAAQRRRGRARESQRADRARRHRAPDRGQRGADRRRRGHRDRRRDRVPRRSRAAPRRAGGRRAARVARDHAREHRRRRDRDRRARLRHVHESGRRAPDRLAQQGGGGPRLRRRVPDREREHARRGREPGRARAARRCGRGPRQPHDADRARRRRAPDRRQRGADPQGGWRDRGRRARVPRRAGPPRRRAREAGLRPRARAAAPERARRAQRGRAREPAQGRVRRDDLARAAHAAQRDPGLDADPEQPDARRRDARARALE